MAKKLTHIDRSGSPKMVDVSHKKITLRRAQAQAIVELPKEALAAVEGNELHSKKGPVFHTAIIAGVMAAKKTHELIPFCHPLQLDDIQVKISLSGNQVLIETSVAITARTGVEMEALTAASVAALTVYDMCKALSHNIVIREIRLVTKTGGKTDFVMRSAR